ncbi:heterocyst frequency control protein PatD [Spirulina sp. CCNP1310]|uniref:heterocyst frequency control protein PatD n=1 Tax=Spirulina sp. CCNP1310 TaxID=3110249 RepID=UPI002B21F9D9|nr:heterocyst frequency control protein PatD [Spirulina sp. CCNP1310]MEA5419113.1 heterocyst frequency control protein PatD [Spirulina sp. CCNP1310]
MPSPFDREQYATVLKTFVNLRKSLREPGLIPPDWYEHFLKVRQVYQTTISLLEFDQLGGRERSLLTEIHRLGRLLETQALFLQSARRVEAIAKRQGDFVKHLNQVIQLLEQLDPNANGEPNLR